MILGVLESPQLCYSAWYQWQGVTMQKLQQSPLHEEAENGAHYLELESKGIAGKSTQFFYRRGDGSSLYAT